VPVSPACGGTGSVLMVHLPLGPRPPPSIARSGDRSPASGGTVETQSLRGQGYATHPLVSMFRSKTTGFLMAGVEAGRTNEPLTVGIHPVFTYQLDGFAVQLSCADTCR
jgi:hypothetical protein